MRKMDFGTSVSALLETFDNCIALLKAFKRSKKDNGSRKVHRSSNQQSLLRHSLKTDRKKVERAYSARLSEAGSSFEKGDCKMNHLRAHTYHIQALVGHA